MKDEDRYQVLIYNDERNTFQGVTKALRDNTTMDHIECYLTTLTIDKAGKVTCYKGRKKVAEKVRDNLRDEGLHVELTRA